MVTESEDKEKDPEVIRRRHKLFTKYVKPYYNMIYKLCIRYSWASENVEENYNQVLENFYRRIETYDKNRPIMTWLHIVTKRQVRTIEIKRASMYKRIGEDDERAFYHTVDACHSEGSIDRDQKYSYKSLTEDNYREMFGDEILEALDKLNPIQRDAIILQAAGCSLEEIMNIEYAKGTLKAKKLATIKSRLFLARQNLKKMLTRDGKRIPNQTNS